MHMSSLRRESDMTGVPREVAEHRLNANPSITPVRQKKRGIAPERSVFQCNEVDKLVDANILMEVRYQTWVANPVLVKKANGSWRMCVDFKDINKACPKDNYSLPEIDCKVESFADTISNASSVLIRNTTRYRWPLDTKTRQLFTPITGYFATPRYRLD
ncbi:uncharacterized protein [Rutidosis leptorrhynchoides]|uniref:uncharacterized protein n=1 Tax=Rutidosis leptorrhynchoides TaxID=125765 RepID=UPI003A98DB94